MNRERRNTLLEATAGIRDGYIEEAAAEKPANRRWIGFVAAAAVLLVLLLSLAGWPQPGSAPVAPLFAVYAHAQGGSPVSLNAAGEMCDLRIGTSEQFPDQETFTLDILLLDTDGGQNTLQNSDFTCSYPNGIYLRPGESDENLSISWLEENGLFGYRITGWCDRMINMDIRIKWKDGMILHQSSFMVRKNEEYKLTMYTFYNYEQGLSTEALMDKIFDENQNYTYHNRFSSSVSGNYTWLRQSCGGFAELEQRRDAPSLLVQRWIKERQNNEHKSSVLEYCGLTGLLLSQDIYWDRLSQAEKDLIEKYLIDPEYQNDAPLNLFPNHKTFTYEMAVEDNSEYGPVITIGYTGQELWEHAKHVGLAAVNWETVDGTTVHQYIIVGWFEAPTEVTLTIKERQGDTVLRQDRLLITPTEDGYLIELLEQTP